MKKELNYNTDKYYELPAKETNTLQLFITNRCNKRCKGCFYAYGLGKAHMSLEDYKHHIEDHRDTITKVTLLGGEPTLHPQLEEIIKYNQDEGLKTTIYTNGIKLKRLENIDLTDVKTRVGVYGAYRSEKPLNEVPRTDVPIMAVYMIRSDNIDELIPAAKMAEKEFNCSKLMISSIRDIAETGDYWKDNEDTISNEEYFDIVQGFLDSYDGGLEVQISKRGVIKSRYEGDASTCRFGNVFPDGTKIQCPFDISLQKTCSDLTFGKRKCNKDSLCILRKIVLARR